MEFWIFSKKLAPIRTMWDHFHDRNLSYWLFTLFTFQKVKKVEDRSRIAEQNLAAIEALVKELNLKNCNLRAPDVLAKLYNFSLPRSTFEQDSDRLRTKRDQDKVDARAKLSAYETQTKYLFDLYSNEYKDDSSSSSSNSQQSSNKKDKKSPYSDQDIIGIVFLFDTVPYTIWLFTFSFQGRSMLYLSDVANVEPPKMVTFVYAALVKQSEGYLIIFFHRSLTK